MIKRGNLLKEKRADSLIFESTIFITLNTIFFVVLLAFIFKSANGAAIYEQAYSKQIALLIDNAKPRMTLTIDISEGIKIAEKNKLEKNDLTNLIRIDEKKKEVIVKLDRRGGYRYMYFSDYNIETKINNNKLIIIITGENNE